MRGRAAGLAGLMVLFGIGVTGCGGSSPAAANEPIAVSVSMTSCGPAWSAPSGGRLSFQVTNEYRGPIDVYLANASTGAYYAEFEGIGAGAALTQSVVLGDGGYRFVCFPDDAPSVVGPTTQITGASPGATTPGLMPVTQADLIPAAQGYQKWVVGRLPTLLAEVRALRTATAHGDLTTARRAWLTAHLTYETLGAAYDAFGDADAAINAMPSTETSALQDPHLEGFHKIEALLWHDRSARSAAPYAAKLVDAVTELRNTFRSAEVDPTQIALRAHEIVENAIQFELTGRTDAGSHTNLATIAANLRGAQQALSYVAPLLTSRYPELSATRQALAGSLRLVTSFDRTSTPGPGGWTPLGRLSTRQRSDLDTSLQRTVELLSPVAAICDIRQVPEE